MIMIAAFAWLTVLAAVLTGRGDLAVALGVLATVTSCTSA